MKLVLTWLLGVPVLVLAMVVARAMSSQGLELRAPVAAVPAERSACPRQGDFKHMDTWVAKDGDRVACDRRAVK
jgi:hypothetical protein